MPTTHTYPKKICRRLSSLGLGRCLVFWAGLAAASAGAENDFAVPKTGTLHAQVVAESLVPVHPGVPGKAPFWNGSCMRFIYAPAFDFKPVKGVAAYKFSALSLANNKVYTFQAAEPWAPLTPVWQDLPTGRVELKVEALNEKGEPTAEAGRRTFFKAAAFDIPLFLSYNPATATNYLESSRQALEAVCSTPAIQCWKKVTSPQCWGRVYNEFSLSRYMYYYQSVIIGSAVQNLVLCARLADNPAKATEALDMARNAARYLISVSEPATAPFPYLPPSYSSLKFGCKWWGKSETDAEKEKIRSIMLPSAIFVADVYLNLYDATHEKEFFDAAIRIADTIKKVQLPSGTWPLVVNGNTGEVTLQHLAIPARMIDLFDRLICQYGKTEYREVLDKAVAWMFENTMKTFNWDAQNTDDVPGAPYKTLASYSSTLFAVYLFKHARENPDYLACAEELMRFAEDQFIVWQFPDGNITGARAPHIWVTPCVLSQLGEMTPYDLMSAIQMTGFMAAYQATGKKMYLLKAEALAEGLLITQNINFEGKYYPTGMYAPSSVYPVLWLSCHARSADAMAALGKLLSEKEKSVGGK